MQLPAARDLHPVGAPEVFHFESHVHATLALEAVLDLAQGHRAPFGARERSGVDQEEHRDRGLFDVQGRKRGLGELGGRQCIPDADLVGAGEPDDVAGDDLVDLRAVQTVGHPQVAGPGGLHRVDFPGCVGVGVGGSGAQIVGLRLPGGRPNQGVSAPVHAREHPAAPDLPDVVTPGQRGDLHAERRLQIYPRSRDLSDDRLEQGLEPLGEVGGQVPHQPAVETRAVEHREVGLTVGGSELDEQVEGQIEGTVGVGVWDGRSC